MKNASVFLGCNASRRSALGHAKILLAAALCKEQRIQLVELGQAVTSSFQSRKRPCESDARLLPMRRWLAAVDPPNIDHRILEQRPRSSGRAGVDIA